MADEDITLDGKPLHSLRVTDLKAALEQRNLQKSGQKNTLIKRLKGALMLENLQRSSSSHSGLQPNSQIGEEMSQNSFIQQYLAKQQELLRQRLEREAQQDEESDDSPAVPEEDEDHSEDNDISPYVSDKHRSMHSKPPMTTGEVKGGDIAMGYGTTGCGSDMEPGPTLHPLESLKAPGARVQRATFHQGHKEPQAPSPPRAVASLSVRVLDQPDRQGLPPAIPQAQDKEGTAPSEPGSAHPVFHMSRSASVSAGGQIHEENENDSDDDGSEDDEDWGPGHGGARPGNKEPQQMPPSVPSTFARSKRKRQPPQHIPPPQAHHNPMQLRHPTPPPSPPPNLFPLPDTPKQSPPDADDQERGGPEAARGPRVPPFPPPTVKRQDSDSSSRSSSPEPPMKRRPGPLSLLVHKMESEGAFCTMEANSAADMSEETAYVPETPASSSKSLGHKLERKSLEEIRDTGERRGHKKENEREQHKKQEREQKTIQEQKKEENNFEEENENKREQLDQEEEQEKKRNHQEKESQNEEKKREEKLHTQKYKKEETSNKDRVAATETQDSDSSSDSDSTSSSSQSSSSSTRDKTAPARLLKRSDQGKEVEDDKKLNLTKGKEKQSLCKREVSEPSTATITEVEPDSENSLAEQPPPVVETENSEGRLEESSIPKAFAARKISLATGSKVSPATTDGGSGDGDTGSAAGRKRRWGSSTTVTAKKPSISITTDSLKSLIPDIKVNQEAVVDLHPEELQLSGDEENVDTNQGEQDKGLKIRRTVTQVVPCENQENGQTNEDEDGEKPEKEKQRRMSRDKRKNSVCEEALETQTTVKLDGEAIKVTPSDSVVRRSISQQKSGVSVTIDDPVRTTRQPSPPHGKVSNIIHVTNLVRPFTLGQLKELLNRTGSVGEEGFWIDKIKSHCFVTYATTEEAVASRAALHKVKWPLSNPKFLNVDFSSQDELDFHKGILKPEKAKDQVAQPSGPQIRLPPLMPEQDRDRERDRERDRDRDKEQDRELERAMGGVRDLWAEREREMQRRERARGEREWDRDKIREFAKPGEDERRSRSRDRERRRRERAKSKERKTDKKEKEEPPAKLLDDLFLKTKAAPCIYWLPHTEDQAVQRLLDRTERQKERERRHKEQKEEEDKKREEEKKERLRGREKDGGSVVSGGAVGRVVEGDRERERGRDKEGEKRRDSGHRRPSEDTSGGRRPRSHSNPRDRRR